MQEAVVAAQKAQCLAANQPAKVEQTAEAAVVVEAEKADNFVLARNERNYVVGGDVQVRDALQPLEVWC